MHSSVRMVSDMAEIKRYEEMKDSGIEWIGEIPEHWSVIKNKYLLSRVYSGGTPTASNEDFYTDKGIPFVSISDMSTIDYVEETKRSLTLDGINDKNLEILPKGTVLYSIYATIGAISELKVSATISQAILALFLKPIIEKSYYKYNLQAMRDYIFFSANGNTQFNLNATKVWNFYFAYPPMEEQIIIEKYLDTRCSQIDEIIEEAKKSIEDYKVLKDAVIANTVLHGLDKNVLVKNTDEKWCPVIPTHWRFERGKYLFKETNIRSVDGSEELLTVSQYTGITPRSMKNVNMFEATSLVDYKICAIDNIVANTMWMWAGAVGVSQYHGVVSPSYNTYQQIKSDYNSRYLDYLLRTIPLVSEYKALSTGIRASRLRLYPYQFLSIRYPVPPMSEQKAIVEYLDHKVGDIVALISEKQSLIEELQAYKKSLIYEVVTGKRKVN